jgi:serine/threonine protein kinase
MMANVQAVPLTLDSPEVPIGQRMGNGYLVTRLLGRGGMGVVLEARHEESSARVAIKVLHPKHLDNAEAVTRFLAEGRAAERIRGHHTVRVFESGTHDDGRPFLVMELLEGRDLATLLDEGALPLAEAARILLQACVGMAEVHAHGIVHRDLKPSNLFIARTSNGPSVVKVLDFGIAKGALDFDDPAALALTQTLVAMGTPLYMSPEQIRSSKAVDARSDVWSLGAIFYETLTGSAPFRGNTVTHITAQVLESDPTAPSTVVPGLPRAVDAVVQRALAKRPEDRYVDVAALAHALAPFVGDEGLATATRCSEILRGAHRELGSLTSPAIHDDPLGGTHRFAAVRRQRLSRRWVAVLALFALVLSAAAIHAFLEPRGEPQVAARAAPSALPSPTSRALPADAAPADGASASTSPTSTSSSAVLVLDAKSTSSASIPVSGPPTAPPSAPRKAATVTSSPATAIPKRPEPDDPFAERN